MPRSRKRNRWPNQYETKSPVTAPTIATTMIGIMGMPAIAPAAATAMRIGVPGTTIPRTATASTMAAFCSAGRARSVVDMMLPRLDMSRLRSSSAVRPCCRPMFAIRPSGARAARFLAR